MGKNREGGGFSKRSIRRNSLVLMTATLVSRLLGIIRIRLVSTFYGGSGIADVINFSFSLPNNIRKLLAEGALSSAFIPVLTRVISEDSLQSEGRSAQRLLSRILGFQLLAILPLTLIVLLFPAGVVNVLSDFSDTSLITIAERMMRYFIIYLYCISLASIVQATLHSCGKFITAAVAPLLFSISVIIILLFFALEYGEAAFRFGVVAGGFLHLLTLLPVFYRLGYRITFSFRFTHPDFLAVLSRFLPALSISLILALTQQVSVFLATGLDSGGVTAFSNSIVFYQMPYGVFYISIATVFFPAMSRLYQNGENSKLMENLIKGYEYIFVFLLPSLILLFLLSEELVFSILQKGKFSPVDAMRTASSLRAFAVSLLAAGLFNFNQRFLFATDKFKWALISALLYAAADITATITAIRLNMDVYSFGIGSCAGYSSAIILQIVIMKKTQHFDFTVRRAVLPLLKITAVNIPLLLIFLGYRILAPHWYETGSTLRNFLILSAMGGFGFLLTLTVYRIASIDFLFRKSIRK